MRKLKKVESYSFLYNPMEDYDSEEYDLNGQLLWRIHSLQANGTIYYFYNYYTYDEKGRKDKIYCEMKQVSDEHWRPFTITKFKYDDKSTIALTYNSVPDYKIPDSPYAHYFPPLPPKNRNYGSSNFPALERISGFRLLNDEDGRLLHSYEKNFGNDAVYNVGGISRVHDVLERKYRYNDAGKLISEIHLEDGRISLRKNYEYDEFYEEDLYSVFSYEEFENFRDPYDEPDEEEQEQFDEYGDYDPDDEFEYDEQYEIYGEEHDNLKFVSREIFENNRVVEKVLSGKKIYRYKYNSTGQLVEIIHSQRSKDLFEISIRYTEEGDSHCYCQEILINSSGSYPSYLSSIIDIPNYHYNLELYEYFSEGKNKELKVEISRTYGEIEEINLIDPTNNKYLERRYYSIESIFTGGKIQPSSIKGFKITEDRIEPLFTKNFEYY